MFFFQQTDGDWRRTLCASHCWPAARTYCSTAASARQVTAYYWRGQAESCSPASRLRLRAGQTDSWMIGALTYCQCSCSWSVSWHLLGSIPTFVCVCVCATFCRRLCHFVSQSVTNNLWWLRIFQCWSLFQFLPVLLWFDIVCAGMS